jgi:hypothetical protein
LEKRQRRSLAVGLAHSQVRSGFRFVDLFRNAILTFPRSGSLLGVYATSNGGKGASESYISRWRYEGLAQEVDNSVLVPS